MANLTNHINLNPSGGGVGDITAGDAIRIDAGNEVNVKFDNTSITLNDDGELQATLPIHCIEDYPATVEGEIIINGCGCTAGELYRAVDDSDYYPENTKYFSIGQTQTKILSPESGKRFYLKRTEQKNAYSVTIVHDYKTNYNRYSDINDGAILCSADMLDSVVAEIMTGSHNDHVLNMVLHNAIVTNQYFKSLGGFKYTSTIDGTACYGQAMHSSDELTAAGWNSYEVTYFQNSIVTAIQSIDPSILNVTQFFSKYTVINSIAEEYHLYGHNIIIADNSTNKPVMYAGVSYYSSNDYECVYYRLNKIVDTFTLFRTYPKSGFAMMMYGGNGSGEEATYFSTYEYVLETTNQILSSGTIRTNSSASGSCSIDGDDVCSYTVSCNGTDNNVLTSLMGTTDTAMGEPGGLVWEPVANCPEPEPEINLEAGDAIRIDNGNNINVKFDNTTITLNENGELTSTCCEDSYPQACVLEELPTEENIIVQNNCGDTAGMLYKSVYRSSIPAGTNFLKLAVTTSNISDPISYYNMEDIKQYPKLYNVNFYDTGETVNKKIYETPARYNTNSTDGKDTYAWLQNYYLPEMVTVGELMGVPEGFRSNILTGFDLHGSSGSSTSTKVVATPEFTSNNKQNFIPITSADVLENYYSDGFLELWIYGAQRPRDELDADRNAGAQRFLNTYDVYMRTLKYRNATSQSYAVTMTEWYCYDKNGEIKIIYGPGSEAGYVDASTSKNKRPYGMLVTGVYRDYRVFQSTDGYKMYYSGPLLECNGYKVSHMFFEDPAGQLIYSTPCFITTQAVNSNMRLSISQYNLYSYMQVTSADMQGYYSRELYYTEDQQKVIKLGEQLTRLTDRFNSLETTLTEQIASLEARVTALENA